MEFVGYEVTAEVARTKFSVIHRARDRRTGDTVAIKVFDLSPDESALELAIPADQWRRWFLDGAEVLRRLDHPHMVRVIEVSQTPDGAPYIAMPFYKQTLVSEIGVDPGLEPENPDDAPLMKPRRCHPLRAVEVLSQVSDAVSTLHAESIVHRDIKPGNLLLDSLGGPVVLADFGKVKVPGSPIPECGAVGFGVEDYSPPEQCKDARHVDVRADVYSIGAVAYRMLTGALPVGAFPSLRNVPLALPQGLAALVMDCLAQDSAQRPEDAGQVHRRLTDLGPMPDKPVSPPPKSGRNLRRRKSAS